MPASSSQVANVWRKSWEPWRSTASRSGSRGVGSGDQRGVCCSLAGVTRPAAASSSSARCTVVNRTARPFLASHQPVEVTGVGAELRHGRSCRRRRLATVEPFRNRRRPAGPDPGRRRPRGRTHGRLVAGQHTADLDRRADDVAKLTSQPPDPDRTGGRWWAQGRAGPAPAAAVGRIREAAAAHPCPALLRHNPNTLPADASRRTGHTHAARLGIDVGTVLDVATGPAIVTSAAAGGVLDACWNRGPPAPLSVRSEHGNRRCR